MKADEVMIGDIVSLNGKAMHVTLAMLNTWNDNIQPIPLTRGILEKNGFCESYKDHSLAKDGVFKWYNMYGHCVAVDMNANAIKIQHDCRVLLDLRYNIVVPVHELWHALKLCGVEKEITL